MLEVYMVISIGVMVAGFIMMIRSNNIKEYLGSSSIFLAGLFLFVILELECEYPTQKNVIYITSKDNKTFNLKVDKPNLKLEQDSLSYIELDSIVKKLK
jgi:uncharacterized membrane protein